MRSPVAPITREEYERLYGHESGWEYHFGEIRRKPVGTFLHGVLAILLGDLLRFAGYYSAVEVDLRLTEEWSPRPDACGILEPLIDTKYPTRVDVICEVLSENEDIMSKCRDYEATGAVGQIFVFSIEAKTIRQWNGTDLIPVADILLSNGVTIPGSTVWRVLEKRRKERLQPPASLVVDFPE